MGSYDFIIKEELGVISEKWPVETVVNLITWHGQPPAVDIRVWNDRFYLEPRYEPMNGVTLDQEQVEDLYQYLRDKHFRTPCFSISNSYPLKGLTLNDKEEERLYQILRNYLFKK